MGKREINRLTAVAIRNKKEPGYYADGAGLYLQISIGGSKSWIFRFMLNGRAREMGLGSLNDYSLAEAREESKKRRQQLDQGLDPIAIRNEQRAANILAHAQRKSFEECAREYHKLHAHTWKNLKHTDQWINTLTTYAFPAFGTKDVSDVSKADILGVLEPIWMTKSETASRVRQRIRAVLDWAAARDHRSGHDPRLWDQVTAALPKAKDVKKAKHFESCPYASITLSLQSIKDSGASDRVKLAIEFTVLTAVRSGETRGARWSEIDWEGKRWIIPAERMKAGREHRVPMSAPALEILKTMREVTGDQDLIFASEKRKAFSDMTFTMLLRRLGHTFTIHGFRSTFRDWSAEQTAYPREVCEAALAHVTKDATEAAYFRSDLFEKRRQMMDEWAAYCGAEHRSASATPIPSAKQT